MTLSGEKWKRHIRVILPAFKRAKIMQYIDTIIECTDRFIDQSLIDKQVHKDLVHRCQRLTTNIIGFIAFDYDLESEVGSALQTVLHDFIYYAAFVMKYAWLPRWLSKLYLKLNWKYQRTHRFLYELAEKIVQQEQNNKNSMEQKQSKSLIASLVSSLNEQANDEQLSSGLTQSEMFDEVLTSLFAAFEVTPAVLSWGIFYMSQNPQVQRRIKDELREHDLLMTDDCQYLPLLTQEKLDSLIYCECVIKEVCCIRFNYF
jgi:cytochrome P450